MSTRHERDESRLVIELEPGVRNRVETAAAERGMSARDYVVAALRASLDNNGTARPSDVPDEWSRLSIPSFARDWESDADAVYDDLA